MSKQEISVGELLSKNYITKGLTKPQIDLLISLIEEVEVKENKLIIKENEVSDKFFIIKEGEVEIIKEDVDKKQSYSLGKISAGEVIGEIALIDNSPRSASVRTTKPSKFLVLSIEKLHEIDKNPSILSKLKWLFSQDNSKNNLPISALVIQNISKVLTKRLRTTNIMAIEGLKNDLIHAKARAAMGMLIIYTLVILSVYIYATHLLAYLKNYTFSTTYLNIPLMIFLTIPMFVMILHSGYPIEIYGITLKNWKRSVIESIIYTIPFLFIILIYKWLLIKTSASFADHNLFDFTLSLEMNKQHVSFWLAALTIFLYLLFVPIQEFLARGIMQSSFQQLLVGPHKTFWAILLSNFLFSDFHAYVSVRFGLAVIIPGIFWGWLYARHKTLIGPIVSHLIIGAWALFIVGLL